MNLKAIARDPVGVGVDGATGRPSDGETVATIDNSCSLTPAHILQIGMGFWASKTLLSAVELDVFTTIGEHSITGEQLQHQLELHLRGRDDFLDALVALGLLERDGDGPSALYSNTPETALFLTKDSPAYVGGLLEMANSRLYPIWGHLTDALRTGQPQSEIKTGAPSFFEGVYADPQRLEQFLNAMHGIQLANFNALVDTIDLGSHVRFCDLGGANGTLATIIANAYPRISGVTFDLPPVTPIAQANLERQGVADRVIAIAGDFFTDPFPPADVYLMGNILHDWSETEKRSLIAKAHDALPSGGILVTIENIIDNERRHNAFGLLMSLNMLVELPGGFDYTGDQFDHWARSAGFDHTEIRHLAGPTSAAIAYRR